MVVGRWARGGGSWYHDTRTNLSHARGQHVRRIHDPLLGAGDDRVPGRGAVGVLVEDGPAALGADNQPSVVWAPVAKHFEQVVAEVGRHREVLAQIGTILDEVFVEEVEWRLVPGAGRVGQVRRQRHVKAVGAKFLLAVFMQEVVLRPLAKARPLRYNIRDYDGTIWLCKTMCGEC